MATETTLEIKDLSRTIATDSGDLTLVDKFSYKFTCGRIYSLVGPSGAGKSSVLRLINRLDEPTSGTVTLDGTDYRQYSPVELRHQVGYLFQQPYLFSGTVAENLRYAKADLTDEQISGLCRSVGLNASFGNKQADTISGGEKQRVALARLLALDPNVLLLDEPTASLDPAATSAIEKLVSRISRERCLVTLLVTHEPAQALRMGGETLLLVRGRLVECGPTDMVINHPSTAEGKQYQARELDNGE